MAEYIEKKYCKMIPVELDCRGCTDVFYCSNCEHHIHLGFISREYSGEFCIDCGAEVMSDTDAGEIANCIEFKRRMKR